MHYYYCIGIDMTVHITEIFKQAISLDKGDTDQHIPEGSDVTAYVNKTEYQNCVWALVEVDISQYLGKYEKLSVTLPTMLIHRIDKMVTAQPIYKNRSHFLMTAALRELNRIDTITTHSPAI